MNKQLNLILIITIILTLFTTCKKNKPVTLTIMGETTVSDITVSTAVLTGNVLEVGENMEVYGHVWGETENPDISNYKSEHTKGDAGSFTDNLTELKPETKYYVRTYAKDGDEIVYKDALSFTTLPDLEVLTVVTNEVTDIICTSATCGGNVTNEGESPVTVKGVCWSTSENPTTADDFTDDGSGLGAFISSLTGLTEQTTYYVRAYATNAEGTVYGEEKSFTTPESHAIGDFYEGGVIFYLDGTGQHGLVCAVIDQDGGTGAEWGCNETEINGADGTAVGTGAQNTEDIKAGCTDAGTAADLCINLSLNGYEDWFLPSKYELNQMHINREIIDATSLANGGHIFFSDVYWSSSEYAADKASAQIITSGLELNYSKNSLERVRAVRAF